MVKDQTRQGKTFDGMQAQQHTLCTTLMAVLDQLWVAFNAHLLGIHLVGS